MKYRTIVADPPWPYEEAPTPWQQGNSVKRFLPYESMTVEEIAALPVNDWTNTAEVDAHLYLWTTHRFLPQAFTVAKSWGFRYRSTITWCKDLAGAGLGGVWPTNSEFVLFCRREKDQPRVLKLSRFLRDAAVGQGMTITELNRRMGVDQVARWWLTDRADLCACPTNEQWARLKVILGLSGEMDELVAVINEEKGRSEPLVRASSSWFEWPRGRHSAKPEGFLDLVEQVSPGPYLELFARRDRLGWDTWGNESLNTAEVAA